MVKFVTYLLLEVGTEGLDLAAYRVFVSYSWDFL